MDDPPRLNNKALGSLPAGIGRPGYDRAELTPGIVHLGVGAFHRAHQAAYTEAVLEQDTGWGIVGASLRSAETRDALAPQDGLYTLVVRSRDDERLRVVGTLTDILVAPEDPGALLAAMSDPRVRVVSLTVTEKGYCHDPASGVLNEDHPDIVHDLREPGAPRSVPGFIVEALLLRRAVGVAPFTVLTCDNLPANGRMVRGVLARFAQLRDRSAGHFVESELCCPSSMVDRITPATTDADRAAVAQAIGFRDAWPVITEPFTQWVIEDRFAAGRPKWEEAGAELVADVEPYELMKLRLLNGAHSTLAYLGYLAGYETVAEVMGDENFAMYIRELMDEEITPTLNVPPGVDIAAYAAALRERFRNPALKHRTWQIAMDGSQKLPQRLLGTIHDRLRAGAPVERLALGVAAWMRYVSGTDENGRAIDVRDPLAERLRSIAASAGPSAGRLAPALLGLEPVFGADLPTHPGFVAAVTAALDRLFKLGALGSVAEVNGRGR